MSLLDDVEIPFEDVEMIFTEDAIQAANAFAVDSSIDAVVTWAPFIFDLPEKVKGAKLLVSTVDANHRIADVLVTRADFMKDHADKLKCMANAIFKGIDIVEGSKRAVAQEMAKSFGLPEDEVESAMGDAHLTNYAENKAFFLNPQNPASFESIFLLATEAYQHYGSVSGTIDPEQIKEASIIKSLEVVWPDSKDTYSLRSTAGLQFNLEKNPILSKPVIFSFPPNRNDLDFNYDPDAKRKVEEIARLAGTFGNAIILLEGNVDQSRVKEFEAQGRKIYSQAAVQAKQVSKRRALSVKEILVKQYSISEDRIATKGNGWDKPKNTADPGATENRSVEVKIIGLEQG
jgi:outer membrane protein OmpA-like peptidoglycan-associated protein